MKNKNRRKENKVFFNACENPSKEPIAMFKNLAKVEKMFTPVSKEELEAKRRSAYNYIF